MDQIRHLLTAPEIVVRTWRAVRQLDGGDDIAEAEVRQTLHRLDPLWEELFPAEQARIVELLVERIDLRETGLTITLRTDGLTSVVRDLRAQPAAGRQAA